ncbi:MAG: hypothetical protein IKJ85_05945 [Firmicutes bacterium]|nr:hypothetical protein [Bacillota bacterium]
MPKTEAQLRANKIYLQKLDEFKIRLPKGYKEKIKTHILENTEDESTNAFFKRAIDETIENDKIK